MRLDFFPSTGRYTLAVPRSEGLLVQELVHRQGFDLSSSASTSNIAVLYTGDEYAAVTYFAHGTDRARQQLDSIYLAVQSSWKRESQIHVDCPVDRELWDFQKANIEYALARRHTLVGDEPGLGKTAVGICFANTLQAQRILCIVPASIRMQWCSKIREWTTLGFPYIIYPIVNSRHGVHPRAHWTVVSYELAATEAIGKALAAQKFDLLILDEAHYLKTMDTRRTRAIFGGGENRLFEALAGRADRLLALTGTPLPNRPREAYTLARSLCPDSIDWMNEDAFRKRYNPSSVGRTAEGKMYIDERRGRFGELQNRLRANFMVRHEKHGPNGVMKQLKMPVYDLVRLNPDGPAVKAALAAERLLDIDPENLQGADMTVLGHLSVVRRQMGIAMAPLVADYIDNLIDGGEEKLVIFAWHIEVLNILEARWRKHGVVRIDGRTGSHKQGLVDRFCKDQGIRICLGNILSMGIGTDGLQNVCNHGLIAEPDWVPGQNIQCFDRLDRGGQRDQVQGEIFVVPGSFAERILASALRKGKDIHAALDHRYEHGR